MDVASPGDDRLSMSWAAASMGGERGEAATGLRTCDLLDDRRFCLRRGGPAARARWALESLAALTGGAPVAGVLPRRDGRGDARIGHSSPCRR
jgi:hypothetical protein